jgi:branched-chain amino acid transport system substrate-binding protein
MKPTRAFISLLLLGMVGCGGGGDKGGAAPAASGTVLIGHYGSMTGSEATFGQSTDNGIRLAIK